MLLIKLDSFLNVYFLLFNSRLNKVEFVLKTSPGFCLCLFCYGDEGCSLSPFREKKINYRSLELRAEVASYLPPALLCDPSSALGTIPIALLPSRTQKEDPAFSPLS